jgi:gluconolactonase
VAAAKLFIYSPEAKLLHTVEFGEKPSNMAFGDPDLQSLYITARTSVYRVRLPVKGVSAYQ